MVAATSAEIVLSTTWRHRWCRSLHYNTGSINDFVESLPDPNVTMMTRDLTDFMDEEGRSQEIVDWFGHPPRSTVDYKWIAIDDLDLLATTLKSQMTGHFLRTDSNVGLTPELVAHGLKLLQKQGVEVDPNALSEEIREHWLS